jgi:parallel beta-helix repeat protein
MRNQPIFLTRIVLAAGIFLLAGLFPVAAVSPAAGTTLVLHPETADTDLEIQQALDQLPATGGTVILAPGTYAIHHPLWLSRDHLTLRGSGETTILRLADDADCPVVILGTISAQPARLLHDLCLADLEIDGNRRHQSVEHWTDASNTSGIQNNGIMIQSVSNSMVEHVVAAHCRSGGLVTANGTRSLTVNDFTSFDNQFDGLACYRTENSLFTGLNLHDNQAAGISLDLDFNHNVISDSTLTGNDLGIFMRRSNRNQFSDLTIRHSHHDGVFMAQWGDCTPAGWQLVPQTECEGNHFSGLEIYDCGGVAFRVNDAACINNVIEEGIFSGNMNGGLVQAGANLVRMRGVLD